MRTQPPHASQHGKKKLLTWQTTLGWITVEETQWRLGRRGPVLRPFCARAGVEPRGTSRRLQRVRVDFGAEESFARAVQRVQEHDGVDVAFGRLRRHTLAHGAQMSALPVPPPKAAAAVLVTPMDGSLLPIVTPPGARRGSEKRQTTALARSAAVPGPRKGIRHRPLRRDSEQRGRGRSALAADRLRRRPG